MAIRIKLLAAASAITVAMGFNPVLAGPPRESDMVFSHITDRGTGPIAIMSYKNGYGPFYTDWRGWTQQRTEAAFNLDSIRTRIGNLPRYNIMTAQERFAEHMIVEARNNQ